MIRSFKHKCLRKFHEAGSVAGIQADHAQKLKMTLAALDTATVIEDMDIPGFRLHALKGNRQGLWSIMVNKNWRITFSFENGDVYVVDYEDYH